MQLDLLLDEKLYGRLDQLGDALAKLDAIMDWTPFTAIIDEIRPDRTKDGNGGRPPIKSSVLFKGLLIGELYNLSDQQIEFQITDRAMNRVSDNRQSDVQKILRAQTGRYRT